MNRLEGKIHQLKPGDVLSFVYVNWKGRCAERRMEFESVSVGCIYTPGGLRLEQNDLYLNGVDGDKKVRRSYHLTGINLQTLVVC